MQHLSHSSRRHQSISGKFCGCQDQVRFFALHRIKPHAPPLVRNEWEGLVIYGAVRQVDDLEELDIGIQAMAAIPVGAAGEGIGESDVRVNFGGVTFFSGDHLYADNTGIILSEDPLDIE